MAFYIRPIMYIALFTITLSDLGAKNMDSSLIFYHIWRFWLVCYRMVCLIHVKTKRKENFNESKFSFFCKEYLFSNKILIFLVCSSWSIGWENAVITLYIKRIPDWWLSKANRTRIRIWKRSKWFYSYFYLRMYHINFHCFPFMVITKH